MEKSTKDPTDERGGGTNGRRCGDIHSGNIHEEKECCADDACNWQPGGDRNTPAEPDEGYKGGAVEWTDD